MKTFTKLKKLSKGDKVAIISPSFAAPGHWPHVYQLGLERIRNVFGLEPVEYQYTSDLSSTNEQRAEDLIKSFTDPDIKAVITTIGGDHQVCYVKHLNAEPFLAHPKPFFGYSDNTHIANFLWLHGIPSYYGGCVFTEYAMQGEMDPFTIEYLQFALFESGKKELQASPDFNDIGLSWSDPETLHQKRRFEKSEGWIWSGEAQTEGYTWGGCLESVDELLRHNVAIPTLEEFKEIILFFETSEEIPSPSYVYRFFRALGERQILSSVKGLLVGRPKAWEFGDERSDQEKSAYREEQRAAILQAVKEYNPHLPVVQNMDFGHTAPQICLPYGALCEIDPVAKKVVVEW